MVNMTNCVCVICGKRYHRSPAKILRGTSTCSHACREKYMDQYKRLKKKGYLELLLKLLKTPMRKNQLVKKINGQFCDGTLYRYLKELERENKIERVEKTWRIKQ